MAEEAGLEEDDEEEEAGRTGMARETALSPSTRAAARTAAAGVTRAEAPAADDDEVKATARCALERP